MNSKALNTVLGLSLVMLIGGMSWRDMHPTPKPIAPIFSYYADASITPNMVPGRGGVYIVQGRFTKAGWKPEGMAPTLFAQRQVNLVFRFDELPKTPDAALEKIGAIADAWVRTGSSVEGLVFDYRPAAPDFTAYAQFLKAAQVQFKKKQYSIAVIDAAWLSADKLADLKDYAPLFLLPLPSADIAAEMSDRLKKQTYNVILQFPPGTDSKPLPPETVDTLASTLGSVVTLSPGQALPEQQEQVKLFPKLFY